MKFAIYRQIAALSRPNNGWTKELNFVSWNSREPVYDIRTWNRDHTECGKGVTLTRAELQALRAALAAEEGL